MNNYHINYRNNHPMLKFKLLSSDTKSFLRRIHSTRCKTYPIRMNLANRNAKFIIILNLMSSVNFQQDCGAGILAIVVRASLPALLKSALIRRQGCLPTTTISSLSSFHPRTVQPRSRISYSPTSPYGAHRSEFSTDYDEL